MTGKSLYALRDVPWKGKGFVAIERIPKGTRILSETHIISISKNDVASYAFRSRSLRFQSTSGKPSSRCTTFTRTRMTLSGMSASDQAYGKRSRYAYYLGVRKNRTTRRQALKDGFGFEYACNLCSLPLEKSKRSDGRLDEIPLLDRAINQFGSQGIISSAPQALRYFDQQVRLYYEQGNDEINLGQAFIQAAWLAIANGDLARGRIFSERASSAWETAIGGDSKEAIKSRKSSARPFNQNNIPSALEPNDFEDRFWKRKKAKDLEELTGLRSRANFPAFDELPDENYVDLNFYRSNDMFAYEPRRH
ncbi:hypothetical protein AJ78_05500 [Emergomyces pasteurianus Ep9510]|uniref:SET domain-containing protein n=1 Tax=Emergomyces pasteurianus Ep9510 TaxID=1447872 RepID=A0A1J9QG27_9EURO|nr:hypothetical protein AJ78_05500 [Emergomyces pasteurianus Ep9510]